MTGRDRRALAAGSVAVLLLLVPFKVIPSASRWVTAMRDETVAQQELLVRMQREIATAPRIADSVRLLEKGIEGLSPFVLSGHTVRDAVQDLRARLTVAVTGAGARMHRVTQQVDSTTVGVLGRTRLEVVFDSDVGGLARALAELERDSALMVTGFDVTAGDPDAPDETPELLRVKVRVAGWYLGEAAKTAASDQTTGPVVP